jgi:hypothetical protein
MATSSSSSNNSNSAASSHLQQLPFRADTYGGVIIDPTEEAQTAAFPSDSDVFGKALDASLASWRGEGKRGVWLKVRETCCCILYLSLVAYPTTKHSCPSPWPPTCRWRPPAALSSTTQYVRFFFFFFGCFV